MTTSPQHTTETIEVQPLVTQLDDFEPSEPPRRTRSFRRIARLAGYVVLVGLAVAAVVISFTGLPQRGGTPIELLTGTVKRGTARTEVSGSGVVAPAVTTELEFGSTSSSAGALGGAGGSSTSTPKVASVNVKVGQRVARGAILATLDRTSLELTVDAAQQSYDAAVAARDNPSTTTQNGSTSQDQTDDELDLAVAEAAVALSSAKDNLSAATIAAPHAGIVDAVNVTKGSAAPADSAAVVLRGSGMQVTIDVAEDDIPSIKVGQKASIHLVALDKDVTGTVTAIDAEETTAAASTTSTAAASPFGGSSSSAVTFPVEVVLSSTPQGLRAGMSTTVSVTTGEHADTLLVPLTAVVGSGDTASVRIPDGAHAFSTTSVQVGLTTSEQAEILSGLDEGDKVVTGIVQKEEQSDSDTQTSALSGLGGGGGGFPAGGPPAGFPAGGFPGGGGGGGRRG